MPCYQRRGWFAESGTPSKMRENQSRPVGSRGGVGGRVRTVGGRKRVEQKKWARYNHNCYHEHTRHKEETTSCLLLHGEPRCRQLQASAWRSMHLVGCKTLGSRGQQEETRPAEGGRGRGLPEERGIFQSCTKSGANSARASPKSPIIVGNLPSLDLFLWSPKLVVPKPCCLLELPTDFFKKSQLHQNVQRWELGISIS